jgi:hypothetical protein
MKNFKTKKKQGKNDSLFTLFRKETGLPNRNLEVVRIAHRYLIIFIEK